MEYVIATYRSRSVTMKVYNFLQKNGVSCSVVSTPTGANVGCGLSVKLPYLNGSMVNVLSNDVSFVGFFRVKNVGGRTVVTPI